MRGVHRQLLNGCVKASVRPASTGCAEVSNKTGFTIYAGERGGPRNGHHPPRRGPLTPPPPTRPADPLLCIGMRGGRGTCEGLRCPALGHRGDGGGEDARRSMWLEGEVQGCPLPPPPEPPNPVSCGCRHRPSAPTGALHPPEWRRRPPFPLLQPPPLHEGGPRTRLSVLLCTCQHPSTPSSRPRSRPFPELPPLRLATPPRATYVARGLLGGPSAAGATGRRAGRRDPCPPPHPPPVMK